MKSTDFIKKILFVPLLVLSLSSCSGQEKIRTKTFYIDADYTLVENHVTLLIDGCSIPFYYQEYGIDTLIVGDYLEIQYSGEWKIAETNPKTIYGEDLLIQYVRVTHAELYEFVYSNNPGGGTSLQSKTSNLKYKIKTTHAINEYGTFRDLYSYPVGTTFYGAVRPNSEEKLIEAFYTYKPIK